MGEWKEYKICELGKVVTGTTPSSKFPEEFGNEMPFVTPSDYKNYNKWISFADRYLSDIGIAKLRSRILPKYSLLVTCIGSDMGKVGINKTPVISNQQINSIIPNECVDAEFLYYKLIDSYGVLRMYGEAGTAVPILNKGDFENIEIEIPKNKTEQQAIAEVLSSLDDKIDLLHRQNNTFEQLAETLFRQWFVEDADESWEVKSLKEIATHVIDNRGKTPPTVEYKTEYPLIEVNALNSGTCLVNYDVIRKYVSKETYESWFRKHLKENDIIFSTVGTIGVFSILLENIGAIAQNLIGLRFEKFSSYFIYFFFKMNVENIINLDIGGVQPSIKVPHILEMTIKCPPQYVLEEFHKKVDGNFQKIKSNTQQIRTLTQLRDTLLPKLMSGEATLNIEP